MLKRKLHDKFIKWGKKLVTCRKRRKLQKWKTGRLKRKISCLTEVISEHWSRKCSIVECQKRYSPELSKGKRFKCLRNCVHLAWQHFYSTKAYVYVHECFDLVSPHPCDTENLCRSWIHKTSLFYNQVSWGGQETGGKRNLVCPLDG